MNPTLLRDAKTVQFLKQIGTLDLQRLEYFRNRAVDPKTKAQISEVQEEAMFLIALAGEIEFLQRGMYENEI